MNKKIALFTFLGLVATNPLVSYSAQASQVWGSFCSNVTTGSISTNKNGFSASNYTVKAVENSSVQLNAQQIVAKESNTSLSIDQFQRITHITSTGLLNIILNNQMKQCSKNYYTDSLTPVIKSVQNGNQINMTWNNVIIKNNKVSYKVQSLSAQLSNQGNNSIHLVINFSGLVAQSQHALPPAFVPEQGHIDLTLSPKAYPLILAATSGNTDTTPSSINLPIHINSMRLQNTQTSIAANGDVTMNGKPNLTSANGVIQITNMQTLINASSEFNNSKLKTGLILARFAGRNVGNNVLEWNIQWQGNLFKVNSVPIPVW